MDIEVPLVVCYSPRIVPNKEAMSINSLELLAFAHMPEVEARVH